MEKPESSEIVPFKVVDCTREKRFGVVATSLQDFVIRAKEKLGLNGETVKVVLEQDGTEVDEEDYFSTLERNTSLMLLAPNEKWGPPGRNTNGDEIDGGRGISGLLTRLRGDVGHVSLLGGCELELLSDMDPDSLTDIVPDRSFLDQLKEASSRLLNDKRQAQEALDLLKLYHSASLIHEDVNKRSRVAQ
ncbi:DNA fragmentation factor subunit alpha-like [Homalodisca vitripennis]|uniref:DNA fragmentation factor subunit alpha-like n=1 Tax=Homalodisca vitripennis TaxID=197043 RepID=UPI001EEBD3BB|nr:DNA fragmentation factor subunit alpha-like [Homalodisca vitripennis]